MAQRSSVKATIQALRKKLNQLPEKDRSEIVTLIGRLTSAYAKAASGQSAARVRKSTEGDSWIGVAKSAGWVGVAKPAPRRS